MSPDREATRPDDRLVGLLSHWLARHVDDVDLRRAARLAQEQAELVAARGEAEQGGNPFGHLREVELHPA